MKSMSSWLTSSSLVAGVLAAMAPAVVFALPARQSATQPTLVAQAQSTNYQIYQSPQLGFRIAYPKGYTVDTSDVSKGYLRFSRDASTLQASAAETSTQAQPGGQSGSIVASTFDNPGGLSALEWAQQNGEKSFFETGRQSNYQSRKFAGQNAIAYSWCASQCGDSVVFPSRDGKRIIVLSAVYQLPGDAVRWEFQNTIGKFRFN